MYPSLRGTLTATLHIVIDGQISSDMPSPKTANLSEFIAALMLATLIPFRPRHLAPTNSMTPEPSKGPPKDYDSQSDNNKAIVSPKKWTLKDLDESMTVAKKATHWRRSSLLDAKFPTKYPSGNSPQNTRIRSGHHAQNFQIPQQFLPSKRRIRPPTDSCLYPRRKRTCSFESSAGTMRQ